jgi:flagella basal body P-ring formation protein FlgA
VSEPPIPQADRLRPPTWRDKRLVIGVVLVLSSVVLGAAVVARADDTEPMYAASHVLVPGQALTAADVHLVRVQLGAQSGRYLSAGRALAADRVVVHSVAPGELVPLTAVGSQADVDVRPVPVPILTGAADGVKAGSVVDVWVAQVAKAPSIHRPSSSPRPRWRV